MQQKPISQVAGALAIVSGLAPQERWARIAETITDPAKLVVRSWTGGESGEYSHEKMQKQFMGIYEADWDTERQIVIGEPFISYLVHDAVAEAGLAGQACRSCTGAGASSSRTAMTPSASVGAGARTSTAGAARRRRT